MDISKAITHRLKHSLISSKNAYRTICACHPSQVGIQLQYNTNDHLWLKTIRQLPVCTSILRTRIFVTQTSAWSPQRKTITGNQIIIALSYTQSVAVQLYLGALTLADIVPIN
eukprot:3578153-Ditylum_brightwellii.AAC.1